MDAEDFLEIWHVVVTTETIDQPTVRTISAVAKLLARYSFGLINYKS